MTNTNTSLGGALGARRRRKARRGLAGGKGSGPRGKCIKKGRTKSGRVVCRKFAKKRK